MPRALPVIDDPKAFLTGLFEMAVAAADPRRVIKPYLPQPPKGRTIVVGIGKAAGEMAAAFRAEWSGPAEGIVVVPHGVEAEIEGLEVLHSAHPVPDEAGFAASRRLLDLVSGLSEDDLVIALVSGGGSSLLPCPAGDLTLDDEIAVNRALLRCGAPISEMNVVRKFVSRIKGGRLAAAAAPAKLVTLIVSDVPGDQPWQVASGPTVADDSKVSDALDIIARYRMELPEAVMHHLHEVEPDAPLPDDPRLSGHKCHVIASANMSLEAAAKRAEEQGVPVHVLSDAMEGEARHLGSAHAAIAREIHSRNRPFAAPVLLLSGGETTVTIEKGVTPGRGGRNSEFLLSLALAIRGLDHVHALAADTDGIDGSETNAGAYADGTSFARLAENGDPGSWLFRHDAYSAFETLGDLIVTGPTGTNVNDFRAVLVTGTGN